MYEEIKLLGVTSIDHKTSYFSRCYTSALHNVQNKASSPVPCSSAAPSCLRQSSCTNNAQKIPPMLEQDFELVGSKGIFTPPTSPTEPFLLELAPAIELLEADDGEECSLLAVSSNFLGRSFADNP